jgi:hypothetical protein
MTRNRLLSLPDEGNGSDAFFTPREAAAYLRVSLRHLQGRTDIPVSNIAPATSRRRMMRYRRSELDRLGAACGSQLIDRGRS